MALYAQVKDGLVKNVWDSAPPVPVGEDGWVNAVEVTPEITSRQEFGQYTYVIDVDLVTITREVLDISFDEKKQRMLAENDNEYQNFLDKLVATPAAFTQEIIDTNRVNAKQNQKLILDAKTYDALESVVLSPIVLF